MTQSDTEETLRVFNRDYERGVGGGVGATDTIKLTFRPFHVWKEVITALYTADSARPVMTEGWTQWFLCTHRAAALVGTL